MKISSALDAAESGIVVCQVFVLVLNVDSAQEALDEKLITASGTFNVNDPKVIVPPVTVS